MQFHWDRLGREDEHSSCWIRCAQNMGGAGWGFIFIPRIGMEVVVQFIEGDPDRPLVTSVVYNGENPTPYGLPEEKTRTSLKTWSTPRTGGYNELRFEDLAGLEQLYTQAERNMDTLVKNDQSLMVNRHRAKHIQGNESNNIDQNRTTQVGGHEAKEVQGNQDNQVHGPQGQSTSIDANQILQIGQKALETVGMLKQVTVGKSKLTMDAEGNITLEGAKIVIKASGPVTVNGSVIDLN